MTTNTAERLNSVTLDSATAAIDGLHVFQAQAIQMGEAWLKMAAESQRTVRELTSTFAKQSLAAQNLWRQYINESIREVNGNLPFEPKSTEKAASK